ncbi:MAG: hypothetical protein JSU08_10855 [Acidobacteria bacterium]|nr:hypothetical protein [Acidobacteriota bacterium]
MDALIATSAEMLPALPSAAPAPSPILVVVQREWNGWRKALVPLYALEDVHWHQPAGAPRPLVHGYVSSESLLSGDVPHDWAEGGEPRLLVCVLRRHTVPSLFDELARRADAGKCGMLKAKC